MGGQDWLPATEVEFDAFFKNYCQIVAKKTTGQDPEWTHIPSDRVTELSAAYTAWYIAWNTLKAAHTSADVLAKNEAEAAGKTILREFNQEFILHSRYVTDAERREIGCPVHDQHPTPIPAPTSQPEADPVYPGTHMVELVNIRAVPGIGSDDPRSDYGTRIHFGVLDAPGAAGKFRIFSPPKSGDDLPHSIFTRKKKHLFDFSEEDRGKTVYFCLRYETPAGGEAGKGPWGPLFHAIIP
jgi:hypothetical protein